MKKFLLALFTACSFTVIAQPVANCSMMCVLDIQLDTVNNEMEVTLFNGDTNHINYPTIQVIDLMGDTVGNPQGLFYFFAHSGQSTMVHEIPTTLTSLPPGFMCMVLVTDQVWDTTCYFQYPMSCPLSVGDEPEKKEVNSYPNPSAGLLIIELPSNVSGPVQIEIVNTLGEVFYSVAVAVSGRIELNISGLSRGVYFVNVIEGEERFSQRIIRQ
jgi:hypothetical protein